MQWWLIVVIVICAIVAAVIALLFLDKYLRREKIQEAVKVVPLKTTLEQRTYRNTLIVYLPGILANADMISPRVLKSWSEHGEVWGANYGLPRFLPDRIAYEVSEWVLRQCEQDGSIRNVVFIGSSMGGLLANDVLRILQLHTHMFRVKTYLMAVDAPTEAKDLQWPFDLAAPALAYFPFGPFWSSIFKPVVIPPKKSETDSDVDPDWLAQQVAAARSFSLSFYRDQVMYIVDHGTPKAGSITCPVVCIRSTKDDDTVRYSAARKWQDAATNGQWFEFRAKGAKHAAFAQNPAAYEEVFPRAFKALGL